MGRAVLLIRTDLRLWFVYSQPEKSRNRNSCTLPEHFFKGSPTGNRMPKGIYLYKKPDERLAFVWLSFGGPEGDRTLEPHVCEPCALPAELRALIHIKRLIVYHAAEWLSRQQRPFPQKICGKAPDPPPLPFYRPKPPRFRPPAAWLTAFSIASSAWRSASLTAEITRS